MSNNLLQMSDRSQHSPLLAFRDHQNQSRHRLKSDFPEGLVQATLHCVGQASLQMENMDTSLCKRIRENQLDATEWFIALIICSTCFGHLHAHLQEFETVLV